MSALIDHTRLHRTAKYFMDNGRAATHDDAMDILRGFGASIRVGPEAATSAAHQIALLTLVNLLRRTLLGGVEVIGVPDAPLLVPLARARNLADAVRELGGTPAATAIRFGPSRRSARRRPSPAIAAWQLTWQGWRGGVLPGHDMRRLADDDGEPAGARGRCGRRRRGAVRMARERSSDGGTARRRPLSLESRQPTGLRRTRASLPSPICPRRSG